MEALKKQIIDSCRELDQRKFVANHDGNISARIADNKFIATPTGFAKRDIKENDLIIIDSNGATLEGNHKVFSEWKWHQAIYESFSQVSSVVHAHPPYAMAMGLTKKQLGYGSVPEAVVSLGGPIQTLDFVSPLASLIEIKTLVQVALANCYAVLVPGNGVFTVGEDPTSAYLRTELVEHISKSHHLAMTIGQVTPLDADLVKTLLNKRPTLRAKWHDVASSPEKVNTSGAADLIREIIRQELSKSL